MGESEQGNLGLLLSLDRSVNLLFKLPNAVSEFNVKYEKGKTIKICLLAEAHTPKFMVKTHRERSEFAAGCLRPISGNLL